MMKKFGCVLIVLVLLSIPLKSLAVTVSDEINTMLGQYASSFKAENLAQVISFFTDPCNIGGTGYQLSDLQAPISGYFGAQEITVFEITDIQITVSDATNATVNCKEHTVDSLSGETLISCQYMLVKQGNKWKIVRKDFI